MRRRTASSRSVGIGRAFFEATAGVDESFVRDGGADTECAERAQRGGLHVPVPLAAADPAREGVRGRERHGLMPAGAARESRGRIRAGGSGPHGMRGDGGVTRTAGSGSGACRGRYGGGTGQRCAPGHRVLPGVRAGRPARFCRWPPADSVPRAGAPGRKLSGSAPPDVIRDISHWPRAVREGWRGAVGVWRRDAPRRP